MDKLQWFKFCTTDWALGKIQRCPEPTQFRFLKLCISYWNKECCLSKEDAILEIGNEHFELLFKNKIVKVDNENISILFLDEQFAEILDNSEKQRNRVNKRWEKHRLLKHTTVLPIDTTVLPNDTEKNRIEEIRKDGLVNNDDALVLKYNSYAKQSEAQTVWIETITIQKVIKVGTLPIALKNFNLHLIAQRERKTTLKDYQSHFVNWMNKRNQQKGAAEKTAKNRLL